MMLGKGNIEVAVAHAMLLQLMCVFQPWLVPGPLLLDTTLVAMECLRHFPLLLISRPVMRLSMLMCKIISFRIIHSVVSTLVHCIICTEVYVLCITEKNLICTEIYTLCITGSDFVALNVSYGYVYVKITRWKKQLHIAISVPPC